jgi:hypothetical protein
MLYNHFYTIVYKNPQEELLINLQSVQIENQL